MHRQVVIATLGALSAAAICVAAPVSQPPVGPTDQFDIALSPSIDEPGIPGRTPPAAEFGPGTAPPTASVPLPGPALMGAVGLGALLSIRRRWSDRD